MLSFSNNMQYKFFRNGVEEKVEPETWSWIVTYSDNTSLKQFDDSGLFHQFCEIDQSRLAVFKMVSSQFDCSYTLLFEKGMKLIHYYENFIINANTPDESRTRVYCFGYQKNKEKLIMAITPSGELVVTNDITKLQII